MTRLRISPHANALAVPATPEATAMETTTDAVRETATPEMGGTEAAIHTCGATHAMTKTASYAVPKAGMGETYTVIAETHGHTIVETVTAEAP
jgi:hypothetical protein